MRLRSIISHHGWETDGFLKPKPMQCVVRGYFKPSWRDRLKSAPSLTLSLGAWTRMGEEGMKPCHSFLLIHQQWKSCQLQVQTNSMFVLCLIHTRSELNFFPKQRGPALQRVPHPLPQGSGDSGGMSLRPLHTHTHTHTCPRMMHKELLESTASLPAGFCALLPWVLLPARFCHLCSLWSCYNTLGFYCTQQLSCELFKSWGLNRTNMETKGTFITGERQQGFFLNQRFSYSRTFVTGADL